jgi:hypothetical protein
MLHREVATVAEYQREIHLLPCLGGSERQVCDMLVINICLHVTDLQGSLLHEEATTKTSTE